MLLAAKLGHNKDMKLLIKHRASLRVEDDNGCTAFHWAVAGCHKQVVQRLLRKKVGICHVAADGRNPLQRAILDDTPRHANLPMARLLLENGADADDICDSPKRLTILHQAVMKKIGELVVLILDQKGEKFARDVT